MNRPVALVGDIHGDIEKLCSALAHPEVSARSTVFLGDYVNRGADSRLVLDRLLAEQTQRAGDLTFLGGNHDAAFARTLAGQQVASFLAMGGGRTIASYVDTIGDRVLDQLIESVPAEHKSFLANLEKFWCEDEWFAAHSYPDLERMINLERPGPIAVSIVGHHIQPDGPTKVGHTHFIDTGCGSLRGGALTVLLLPEEQYLTF